jgi:hypothetical protein
MKFYQIASDYFIDCDGVSYFATLAAAKKVAREAADHMSEHIEIECVEIGMTKADVIALANRRNWCVSSEVVYVTVPRRGKKDAK